MVNQRSKSIGLPRMVNPCGKDKGLSSAKDEEICKDKTNDKPAKPKESTRSKELETFKKNLIGPGLGDMFMPTPGFKATAHEPNGTLSVDTPPINKGRQMKIVNKKFKHEKEKKCKLVTKKKKWKMVMNKMVISKKKKK
ncbi:hypothetical protein POM88_009324 [Heracleum sosnowskyi]|uniref:Uncharacterized protein n=1 Tax=Heracleum sosnowskyi TaxID=360622 RepID=A0AAD8JBA2_9APIA|nr:hypothetical protein POM88_009324 [Heracleum sosnowskyi]